jgi:uncharacterized protein (TIGR02246 family)
MKRLIFLSLFFLSRQISNAQSYDSAGVIKAIQKLGVALSKPDPRILADLFTEDGDFTNVIDSTIHGRQNIYAHHYKLWVVTGRPATRTVHILGYRIRFVGPDAAAIEVRWDNIHTMDPDGTTLPNRDGVCVSVMTRQHGQWYIAVARNLFLHDGTPGHELKKTQ